MSCKLTGSLCLYQERMYYPHYPPSLSLYMINTLSTLSTLHKLYLYTKKGFVSVWGLGRSKFSKYLFWSLGRSKRGGDHFSHSSQVVWQRKNPSLRWIHFLHIFHRNKFYKIGATAKRGGDHFSHSSQVVWVGGPGDFIKPL